MRSSQLEQFFALLNSLTERLLAQHVLPGPKRVTDDGMMRSRRSRHDDSVDLRVSKHSSVLALPPHMWKKPTNALQPLLIDIRDRDHLAISETVEHANVIRAPPPAPDHRDVYHAVFTSPLSVLTDTTSVCGRDGSHLHSYAV